MVERLWILPSWALVMPNAFDNVLNSLLLEKLAAHSLDGCTLDWVKKWVAGPETGSE